MAAPTTTRPLLAGLDPALLKLPFYEPRHTEFAERITAWTAAQAHLFARSTPGSLAETRRGLLPDSPAEAGRVLLRALGDAGLLAFLDPGRDAGADGDLRSLCLAREALAYADDLADYAFSIQAL